MTTTTASTHDSLWVSQGFRLEGWTLCRVRQGLEESNPVSLDYVASQQVAMTQMDDSQEDTINPEPVSLTTAAASLHATWKCATSGLASDRGSEQRDLTLLGSLGGCSFTSKHRAWFRFSGSREHGPIPELTSCSRTAGPDGQFGDCNGARSSHPSGELWGEGRALAVRRSSGGRTHACLDLPACPSRRCAEYHPLEFGHGAHHPQHCFRLPIT